MASLSSETVTTIDYLQLIRDYLTIVMRRWKVILLVSIVAALLIFGYRSSGKPTYTSQIDISLLTTRTSLGFDEKFIIQDATVPFYLDESRWDGLTSWATNQQLLSTVNDLVYQKFYADSTTLDRNQFSLGMAANREGDVLHLNVIYTEPEVAKFGADTWAQEYSKLVNVAYISSGKTPAESTVLAETTYQKYLQAGESVEQFELTNNLNDVEAEIELVDAQLKALREQKAEALLLLSSSTTNAIKEFANTTQTALLNQINSSVNQSFEARNNELKLWYARQLDLIQLQNTLQDAQSQIANGTVNLATINTKLAYLFSQVNSSSSAIKSLNLDFASFTATPEETLSSADVAGLLKLVEKSLLETNEKLDALQAQALTPIDFSLPTEVKDSLSTQITEDAMKILNSEQTISPYSEELKATSLYKKIETYNSYRQELIAKREKLKTESQALYLQRDSAWNLYQTLDTKTHEAEAQFAVGSPQVNSPIGASLPERPNQRSRIQASIIGGGLAGLIAIAVIILLDGWVLVDQPTGGNTPRLNRKPVLDGSAMASAD